MKFSHISQSLTYHRVRHNEEWSTCVLIESVYSVCVDNLIGRILPFEPDVILPILVKGSNLHSEFLHFSVNLLDTDFWHSGFYWIVIELINKLHFIISANLFINLP